MHCVQNKMHINDWSAIQTLFDKLNKQLEKSMKVQHVHSMVSVRDSSQHRTLCWMCQAVPVGMASRTISQVPTGWKNQIH